MLWKQVGGRGRRTEEREEEDTEPLEGELISERGSETFPHDNLKGRKSPSSGPYSGS